MEGMMTDTFFDPFKQHINRELLKYAAGTHMFCPNCGNVLDWKTVVLIDAFRDGKHLGQKTGCTNCFKPSGIPSLEAKGLKIEITKYEDNQTKTQ
jgi:predicted RNA-binding Zn-ribbon protein involved in translation (DUF1610 family)